MDFIKRSGAAILILFMIVPVIVLTGCSSEPAAPEEYAYDDLSKYIKLGEYKGLKYDKADIEVTDEEVMTQVDNVVEESAVDTKITKGKVKKDSVVNIDYSGSVDGKKFEGGTAQDQELDIANSHYIDGFAEGIVGHEVGETFDLHVKFPKDYGKEELNGKDAVFETKINYIIEKTVPLYNDKWVADNTDYSTMAEYENSVRKELEDSKRSDAESNERLEVFNQIIEGSEVISFPEAEYQARYDKLVDSYKSYAEAAGTEWDAYLQDQMGMTEEEFETTAKQNAEQTVEAELILNQIARLEKIDLSDEDYESYLQDLLEQSGYTEKSFEEEKNQTVQEYAADNNLYGNYLYKKVMDKVMEYSVAK